MLLDDAAIGRHHCEDGSGGTIGRMAEEGSSHSSGIERPEHRQIRQARGQIAGEDPAYLWIWGTGKRQPSGVKDRGGPNSAQAKWRVHGP